MEKMREQRNESMEKPQRVMPLSLLFDVCAVNQPDGWAISLPRSIALREKPVASSVALLIGRGIGDESRAAKTEVLGNSQTCLQHALSLSPRRHWTNWGYWDT